MTTTFTSASAAKYLRSLEEEKTLALAREGENSTYLLAAGEECDPPEYDYAQTRARVADIDAKALAVRHALHLFNNSEVLPGSGMTIDEALIRLAMMSKERVRLGRLRNAQPKRRVTGRYSSSPLVEHEYANYDVTLAERDYVELCGRIAELQLEIDLVNQTRTFEVDL